MIMIASLLMNFAFAGVYDIYVAPMTFSSMQQNQQIVINHDMSAPYYYTSLYADQARRPNGAGGYQPLSISDEVRVFSEKTIKYAYPYCDYKADPMGCSVQNGHYYVETNVTFNDTQMIVRVTLYDKDATVINSSSRTDDMVVRWIRQQEVTVVETEGRMGKQTATHYGKEDLPLKWEIPYELIQQDIQQAIMGLWIGIKID